MDGCLASFQSQNGKASSRLCGHCALDNFWWLTPPQTAPKLNSECVNLCHAVVLMRCTGTALLLRPSNIRACCWHWGGGSLLTVCQCGVLCGSTEMWNLEDIWAGGGSQLLFWAASICSRKTVDEPLKFLWTWFYIKNRGNSLETHVKVSIVFQTWICMKQALGVNCNWASTSDCFVSKQDWFPLCREPTGLPFTSALWYHVNVLLHFSSNST